MPPFQYSPVQGLQSPVIPQLLEQGGQIQAQALQQAAAARAQGTIGAGQAWGQGLTNLGNIVGNIPQMYAQRQEAQTRAQEAQLNMQMLGMKMAQMKKDQAAQDTWATEVKNPDNLAEDGTVDHDKVAAKVEAAGFPIQANTFLEGINKSREQTARLKEANLTLQQATQKMQQAKVDGMAELAATGLDKLSTEDPITARDHMTGLIAAAATNGYVSEQDARNFMQQSAQAGPNDLKALYQSYLDRSPAVQQALAKEKGAAALQTAVTAKDIAEAQKALTPPSPTSGVMEARAEQLYSQQAAHEADPSAPPLTQAEENALAGYERRKQILGKADAQNMAQAVLNHSMAPSQVGGGMGGAKIKQMVTAEILKQNPRFDWQEAEADYQLSKSPTFQNTVRYMDATLESIPRLEQNLSKLANGKFRTWNALQNAAKNEFNDADVKAFRTDALLLADEVGKIIQGGGGGAGLSDAKLAQATQLFKDSDSVPAMAATANELKFLIQNRRNTLTRGTYLANAPQPKAATAAAPVRRYLKPPNEPAGWFVVQGGQYVRDPNQASQ